LNKKCRLGCTYLTGHVISENFVNPKKEVVKGRVLWGIGAVRSVEIRCSSGFNTVLGDESGYQRVDPPLRCGDQGTNYVENPPKRQVRLSKYTSAKFLLFLNQPPALMTVKRCKAQARIGLSLALSLMPNDLAMINQSQRGIRFDCLVWPLTVLTISSGRIRRSKSDCPDGFIRLIPRLDPAKF